MNGITEKQFATQVESLLSIFQWRWCHFRPARTKHGWTTAMSGHPGFPDYIAVKGERLLAVEIKSEKGKVTPEQMAWLDAFQEAGAETFLWRPSDSDFAVTKLRGVE